MFFIAVGMLVFMFISLICAYYFHIKKGVNNIYTRIFYVIFVISSIIGVTIIIRLDLLFDYL